MSFLDNILRGAIFGVENRPLTKAEGWVVALIAVVVLVAMGAAGHLGWQQAPHR